MSRQSGFSILTVLLVAVVLLGSLVFVFIGAGPNVQGQLNAQTSAQLVAQAQLIAHRIVKCASDYPEGNNGGNFHLAYPIGTSSAVSTLVCPGNTQNLWSGVDGVYLPTPPTGFGDWLYTNAATASISIASTQAGAYTSAIAAAATKIGPAATAAVSTLTLKIIE